MSTNAPLIEGQKFVGKALTTLVMLIAFGGLAMLGWYANEEKRYPENYANLPLIQAEKEPFKIKPSDPGGMKIPNEDIKLYDEITTSMNPSRSDVVDLSDAKLSTPPEEPVKLPMTKTKNKNLTKKVQSARLIRLQHEKKISRPKTLVKTNTIRNNVEIKDTEIPTIVPSTKPKKIAVHSSKVGSQRISTTKTASYDPRYTRIILSGLPRKPLKVFTSSAKKTTVEPITSPKIKRVKKVAKTTKPTPVLLLGGTLIQLGSFQSRATVKKSWESLKQRFPKELSTLSLSIKTADLGPRGVYYRMLAGMFSSKDVALKACKRLISKGQDCLVAR